jgi:hypothetical protein
MVTNTPNTPNTAMIAAPAASAAAIALYRRMADPLAAIDMLGKAIAASGMLGEISLDAGRLLAVECLSSGIPPLSLKRRYHITKYGLMQQASWTMSEFQRAGGTVKELSRTDELAKAELSKDGETYTVSLAWKDAVNEPFVYVGKEAAIVEWLHDPRKRKDLTLKAKYATPLSRTQMLWWRLVGDAIRAHWPEINGGIYSPEEIGDDEAEEVDAKFEVVTPVSEPVIVVPASQVETVTPAATTSTVTGEATEATCSREQAEKIRELFAACGLSGDEQTAVLQKRKANAIRNLTTAQSEQLIVNLTKRLDEKSASQPEPVQSIANNDPCLPTHVDEIKRTLAELAQSKPGSDKRFIELFRQSGRSKLSELSVSEAEALARQLRTKNIEAFFQKSLAGTPTKN